MDNKSWDPSVLGLTSEELDDMSNEEQKAFAIDALNRAADLVQNVVAAVGPRFSLVERGDLMEIVHEIIRVARKSEG